MYKLSKYSRRRNTPSNVKNFTKIFKDDGTKSNEKVTFRMYESNYRIEENCLQDESEMIPYTETITLLMKKQKKEML